MVPEHEAHVLSWAHAMRGDALFTCYLVDVKDVLELRSLATGLLEKILPLPGLGSVVSFSGRRRDSEFFFKFASFTDPGSIFRGDLDQLGDGTIEWELLRRPVRTRGSCSRSSRSRSHSSSSSSRIYSSSIV